MIRKLLCPVLILLAATLSAADIKQILPPVGQSMAVLQAPTSRGTWVVRADEDLAEVAPQVLSDGGLAILVAKPGKYLVRWRQGPLAKWQAAIVDLGTAPAPGPGPTPTPTPAPIPAGGLWVLIVDDPLGHAKLPEAQVAALTAKSVRDFLAAKCANDEAKHRFPDRSPW